jgi:hypothetical protein
MKQAPRHVEVDEHAQHCMHELVQEILQTATVHLDKLRRESITYLKEVRKSTDHRE